MYKDNFWVFIAVHNSLWTKLMPVAVVDYKGLFYVADSVPLASLAEVPYLLLRCANFVLLLSNRT